MQYEVRVQEMSRYYYDSFNLHNNLIKQIWTQFPDSKSRDFPLYSPRFSDTQILWWSWFRNKNLEINYDQYMRISIIMQGHHFYVTLGWLQLWHWVFRYSQKVYLVYNCKHL